MSRKILCRKCGDDYKHHPEDKAMGVAFRKVYLSCTTVVPKGHGIKLSPEGSFTPLADIHCDSCGEIVTGGIVVAVSMWRHEDGTRIMSDWEQDYGTVLTEDAVALHDKLTGKEAAK